MRPLTLVRADSRVLIDVMHFARVGSNRLEVEAEALPATPARSAPERRAAVMNRVVFMMVPLGEKLLMALLMTQLSPRNMMKM